VSGTLWVTFEEGTWSVWLYDRLNPHVDKLVVCNPRKKALLKDGKKSDRVDARKLQSCYAAISSSRLITAKAACVCGANYRGVI
jgi:molybdopterin-guanine dinucleotide biosynthesis protein A